MALPSLYIQIFNNSETLSTAASAIDARFMTALMDVGRLVVIYVKASINACVFNYILGSRILNRT